MYKICKSAKFLAEEKVNCRCYETERGLLGVCCHLPLTSLNVGSVIQANDLSSEVVREQEGLSLHIHCGFKPYSLVCGCSRCYLQHQKNKTLCQPEIVTEYVPSNRTLISKFPKYTRSEEQLNTFPEDQRPEVDTLYRESPITPTLKRKDNSTRHCAAYSLEYVSDTNSGNLGCGLSGLPNFNYQGRIHPLLIRDQGQKCEEVEEEYPSSVFHSTVDSRTNEVEEGDPLIAGRTVNGCIQDWDINLGTFMRDPTDSPSSTLDESNGTQSGRSPDHS